jgi:hypothetical protein
MGMERELLGQTGICGTSREQLIGPLCDCSRICPRGRTSGSGQPVPGRCRDGEHYPGSKCAKAR